MRHYLLSGSSHAAMRAERESAAFMARVKTGTAVLVPRGWGASELRRLAAAKAR